MTEIDFQLRINEFLQRVKNLEPCDHTRTTISELRNSEQWEWCRRSGLYYFVQNDQVEYVGRAPAKRSAIGLARTSIRAADPEWEAVIDDPDTVVNLIAFPEKDWHWVAALEAYMIDIEPRPKFNKRIC